MEVELLVKRLNDYNYLSKDEWESHEYLTCALSIQNKLKILKINTDF